VIGSKWHKDFEYRISQQQYANFVAAYSKIRPSGLVARLDGCDPVTLVIDFDIRWEDSGPPSRLLACRGEDLRRAYLDGFRALGINVVGGKLTPEDDEVLSR